MSLVKLDDIPLLTLEPVAQDEMKLIVKRILDSNYYLDQYAADIASHGDYRNFCKARFSRSCNFCAGTHWFKKTLHFPCINFDQCSRGQIKD